MISFIDCFCPRAGREVKTFFLVCFSSLHSFFFPASISFIDKLMSPAAETEEPCVYVCVALGWHAHMTWLNGWINGWMDLMRDGCAWRGWQRRSRKPPLIILYFFVVVYDIYNITSSYGVSEKKKKKKPTGATGLQHRPAAITHPTNRSSDPIQ